MNFPYVHKMKSKPTYKTKMSWKSEEYKLKKKTQKTGETIDTNTYIMTFNAHKIPKKIKIGYQKINVELYIPHPYKCQVLAPPGPMYTTTIMQKMRRIWHA